MRAANSASVPLIPSASTMQPSLAFWTTTPRIRSATATSDFSAANMVVVPDGAPPFRQAYSVTGKRVVSAISPRFSALKTTSMVISFASEAGGKAWFSLTARRTVPVFSSTR